MRDPDAKDRRAAWVALVLVAVAGLVAGFVALGRFYMRVEWEIETSKAMSLQLHDLQDAVETALDHEFPRLIDVQAVPAQELRNTFTPESVLAGLAPEEAALIRTAEALVDRHFRELGTVVEDELETIMKDDGRIILDPRALSAAGLGSKAELSALLVHDAVHLYQFQVLGARGFLETNQPGVVRLERLAALEGHAEHVTRRVGEQLGWSEAALRLAAWHRRREAAIGAACAGPTDAVYTEGIAHFEALVDELGYPAATRTLFDTAR